MFVQPVLQDTFVQKESLNQLLVEKECFQLLALKMQELLFVKNVQLDTIVHLKQLLILIKLHVMLDSSEMWLELLESQKSLTIQLTHVQQDNTEQLVLLQELFVLKEGIILLQEKEILLLVSKFQLAHMLILKELQTFLQTYVLQDITV